MPLGPAAPLADDSSRSPGVSDAVSPAKQPDGERLASFCAAALAGNRYRGSATGLGAPKPRYGHSHHPTIRPPRESSGGASEANPVVHPGGEPAIPTRLLLRARI